jgi:hypothetical protein
MKRRKRNFVLLEVLVAFAIASCCILPFLHEPFAQLKREMNMLFEMKLKILAQEELAKLEISIMEKRSIRAMSSQRDIHSRKRSPSPSNWERASKNLSKKRRFPAKSTTWIKESTGLL